MATTPVSVSRALRMWQLAGVSSWCRGKPRSLIRADMRRYAVIRELLARSSRNRHGRFDSYSRLPAQPDSAGPAELAAPSDAGSDPRSSTFAALADGLVLRAHLHFRPRLADDRHGGRALASTRFGHALPTIAGEKKHRPTVFPPDPGARPARTAISVCNTVNYLVNSFTTIPQMPP